MKANKTKNRPGRAAPVEPPVASAAVARAAVDSAAVPCGVARAGVARAGAKRRPAAAALTQRQQAALDLRLMDFSVRQIAQVLRTRPRSVKSLLQRARDRGIDASAPRRQARLRHCRAIPFSQLTGKDIVRLENV